MTDLTISPALAERLQAIAEHESRSLEDTLNVLAERYEMQDTPPGSTIPDEAIDVPPDITDAARPAVLAVVRGRPLPQIRSGQSRNPTRPLRITGRFDPEWTTGFIVA